MAYFTLKETLNDGHRIYSLELRKIRSQGGTPKERTTTGITSLSPDSAEESSDLSGGGDTLFQTAPLSAPEYADNDIKYMGEYVLNSNGNKDFGVIPEIKDGHKIYKTAPVRLRIGEHDAKTDKGYGKKHIERPIRLAQLQQNGYNNARDLVEDVVNNYTAIYEAGDDAIFLAKQNNKTHRLVVVKFEKNANDFYYDVKSGWIARLNYLKNKKPLMVKPTGGFSSVSESVTAHYLQQAKPVPSSAIPGDSSNSLSPESAEESSGISGTPAGAIIFSVRFRLRRPGLSKVEPLKSITCFRPWPSAQAYTGHSSHPTSFPPVCTAAVPPPCSRFL
jgi:hypothetical protein